MNGLKFFAMQKNNLPLISIGMPIFNAGNHLITSVQSIVNQSYLNWELLIIDDGSSDGAINYLSQFSDKRIKIFVYEKNIGLAARLNQCVQIADGEYFARMDQDDYSYPNRLKVQLEFLLKNQEVNLLGTKYIAIDNFDRIIYTPKFEFSHEKICQNPSKSINIPHPTWMGKRKWFLDNPYAVPASFMSEDYELLLRTHKSSKFALIDHVLLAYRVRYRTSLKKEIKTRISNYKNQKKYLGDGLMLKSIYFFLAFCKILNAIFLRPFKLKLLMLNNEKHFK